ncbi:MAG: hypothetical protein ABIB47_04750 [Candidatus Woesearchaeota archaeon]
MKKVFFVLVVVVVLVVFGGRLWLDHIFRPPPEMIAGYEFCETKDDCLAQPDICRCMNGEYYDILETDICEEFDCVEQCEDFGCVCIDNRCEKGSTIGK